MALSKLKLKTKLSTPFLLPKITVIPNKQYKLFNKNNIQLQFILPIKISAPTPELDQSVSAIKQNTTNANGTKNMNTSPT